LRHPLGRKRTEVLKGVTLAVREGSVTGLLGPNGAGKTTLLRILAATITPQHLLYNRNAMLAGGIRPHFYCLPILKRSTHQAALLEAATSGDPRFFLGTDSAPHAQSAKECACGCAGCYSAHAAIELYAAAFEQEGALDKLEGCASFHGADFYGLPRNRQRIRLEKKPWTVPEAYPFGSQQVIPLAAGETLAWQLIDE
jgi:dihydroorotase